MNREEHDAAMADLLKYVSRFERQIMMNITVQRIYRMRRSGILHALLTVGSGNQYHVAYRGGSWRRV